MTPERFRRLVEVLNRRQPDLTVLMDKVNKPHNFSAILRSCDAVGVLEAHAVLPEQGLELHHATSAGTRKWIRVRRHPDVRTAVRYLKAGEFFVVAVHPSEDAREFTQLDLTRPTALMLGAELHGISEEGLALADAHVRIPMMGMVHSLNVSVATALLLYEARRQREAAGMYRSSRLDEASFARTLFEWAHPEVAHHLRREGRPYPPLGPGGEVLSERP